MLKFHELDDIFTLWPVEDDANADICATIPGQRFEGGETIRLIAPSHGVDSRVKVIRAERQIDKNGDFSTIHAEFVDG